jgi:uncharacterized oxidoreductase
MNITGNTILITGGGSGIGRGLAEAFQQAGNTVIIAGRRQSALDEVTKANPGMRSMTLDIDRPEAIRSFGARVAAEVPTLNVVIHNAGIMRPESLVDGKTDDAEAMITTKLLGPIRLTAALLPTLSKQKQSTVMTVSSGLAFVPLAMTPTYCATKAAIHSWSMSLRHQLRGTSTQVIELAPPYVQTELMGERQKADPRAMPLDAFIAEVMSLLTANPDATEIIVERCRPLRDAPKRDDFEAFVTQFNDQMASGH